jgi:uncharacterized membrane protein
VPSPRGNPEPSRVAAGSVRIASAGSAGLGAVSVARAVGFALFVLGFGLVALAVARGEVQFYLVAVVPVFTSGSALFGLGILSLLAGFFLLLFGAVASVALPLEPPAVPAPPPPSGSPAAPLISEGSPPTGSRGGGLVFLGPIPIFFGAWRESPPVPYWVAVALGLAFAAALFVLLLVFVR